MGEKEWEKMKNIKLVIWQNNNIVVLKCTRAHLSIGQDDKYPSNVFN